MKTPIGTVDVPRLEELSDAARRRARSLRGASRDAYLASLGVVVTAQDETRKAVDAITDRTEKTFDTLVKRGETLEAKRAAKVKTLRSDLGERTDDMLGRFDGGMLRRSATRATSAVVRRVGMPTRDEVHNLAANVAALSRKVDALVAKLNETPIVTMPPTITVRSTEEGWAVELEGLSAPLGVYATKDEALEAARPLASERAPSQLIVFKKDGTIQDTVNYNA